MSDSFGQIPLTATIAILTPVFCYKLVNEVTGYNKVFNMCNDTVGKTIYPPFGVSDTNNRDKCWQKRDTLMQRIEFKKHWMLLVMGVLLIVASLQMLQSGATQSGIGYGGLLTVFTAVVFHWHHYNEKQKLLVTGGVLATVILYSLGRNAMPVF